MKYLLVLSNTVVLFLFKSTFQHLVLHLVYYQGPANGLGQQASLWSPVSFHSHPTPHHCSSHHIIAMNVQKLSNPSITNALLLKAIHSLALTYPLFHLLSTPKEALTLPAPTAAHVVPSFGMFFSFSPINTL